MQQNMDRLVLDDMGSTPPNTMNMPCCLLVPLAWAPYFLPEPMAPGTVLAMVEKLVIFLGNKAPAEFYHEWCRAACANAPADHNCASRCAWHATLAIVIYADNDTRPTETPHAAHVRQHNALSQYGERRCVAHTPRRRAPR